MGKKYQVFISSTFSDLIEERMAASQTLLTLDCIPVGMEQFPASNMSQMEYITKMLENCDYYILISAGRYGSLDTDGIGFTEKEYDYAIAHGIPVMTFIRRDIETLSDDKKEDSDEGKEKLYAFRKKIKAHKMVKFFSTKDDLQARIGEALYQCMKDYPAVGWIRAEGKEMDAVLEKKMEDYIKEHTWDETYTEVDGEYDIREEDNAAGGKTVIIGSIGTHIVCIKRKIEETIIDTSWVQTNEDRKKLATDPWLKFKCNNVILKDESVENPDFGNGLIKREPFNLYDEGLLIGNPECERKVKVKLRDGSIITTTVYVVDEVPYRNITEFDEYGSVNNPYPTFYCKFKNGSPFAGKQYIDKQTGINYSESQFVSWLIYENKHRRSQCHLPVAVMNNHYPI